MYGFLPMQLLEELRLMEFIHAEDERIPVDAVERGTSGKGCLSALDKEPHRRPAHRALPRLDRGRGFLAVDRLCATRDGL